MVSNVVKSRREKREGPERRSVVKEGGNLSVCELRKAGVRPSNTAFGPVKLVVRNNNALRGREYGGMIKSAW